MYYIETIYLSSLKNPTIKSQDLNTNLTPLILIYKRPITKNLIIINLIISRNPIYLNPRIIVASAPLAIHLIQNRSHLKVPILP
jgi:hypothetical protein